MSELSGNEMSTDLFDEANPYRLVFDTETTGFPSKKVGPKDDAQNVVVELGASLVDVRTWKVQQSLSFIIQTPVPLISDFLINEVHGISNELSLAVGMELDDALAPFIALCKAANWQIVGHNVKFDKEMMAIMLMHHFIVRWIGLPMSFVCLRPQRWLKLVEVVNIRRRSCKKLLSFLQKLLWAMRTEFTLTWLQLSLSLNIFMKEISNAISPNERGDCGCEDEAPASSSVLRKLQTGRHPCRHRGWYFV
jgi:hypothetical protein